MIYVLTTGHEGKFQFIFIKLWWIPALRCNGTFPPSLLQLQDGYSNANSSAGSQQCVSQPATPGGALPVPSPLSPSPASLSSYHGDDSDSISSPPWPPKTPSSPVRRARTSKILPVGWMDEFRTCYCDWFVMFMKLLWLKDYLIKEPGLKPDIVALDSTSSSDFNLMDVNMLWCKQRLHAEQNALKKYLFWLGHSTKGPA